MAEISQVHQKIIEAVRRFEDQLMAVKPTTITVNESDDYLFVALGGAMCEAERRYAEENDSRHLLEELYDGVFDAAKAELEQVISELIGRRIVQSKFTIDPALGNAILVFAFRDDAQETDGGR